MTEPFEQRIRRAREGDRRALDELFDHWRPLLALQARTLLGERFCARVDPADVVQEALAQAWRDLNSFRGQSEGEWLVWLRTLVAGHAAKARRRHQSQGRDVRREDGSPGSENLGHGSQPDGQLLRDEQALRLAAAVDSLAPEMKCLVLARVFEGGSWAEIAERLNKSAGAARVMWVRALRRLREILEEP